MDPIGMKDDIAAFYFSCLVRAMDAVHATGFVNRDFKPENILITSDGRLVQTDFEFTLHRLFQLDDLMLILLARLAPKFSLDFQQLRVSCSDLKIPISGNVIRSTHLRLRLDSDFSNIDVEISNLCKSEEPLLAPDASLAFSPDIIKSEIKLTSPKSTFFKIVQKVGSKQYFSPEIIREDKVSFASDFWALGCAIHDLYEGSCLFSVDQVAGIPTFNAQDFQNDLFSEHAMTVFRQLLHRDPSRRVPSFELQDLFRSAWLDRFSDLDLQAMEPPYKPTSTLYDFNESSSLLADHVSFEFNNRFRVREVHSEKVSAQRLRSHPPRETSNEDVCLSKMRSTSTQHKGPRITMETVKNNLLSSIKTRSVVRDKDHFSRDSNALLTSSQGQRERTTRRLSLSMKTRTSRFAELSRTDAKKTLQLKSEQQVSLAGARPISGLLSKLITPILENKTSSNEEREKSVTDDAIRGEEPREGDGAEDPSSADNREDSNEDDPRNRKFETEASRFKKQMIRPRYKKKKKLHAEETAKDAGPDRRRRAKKLKFRQLHEKHKKKWRNMMCRGVWEERILRTEPRIEYVSSFSNESLNNTMINLGRQGYEKHNSILRNSMSMFNKDFEKKKQKLFKSLFEK